MLKHFKRNNNFWFKNDDLLTTVLLSIFLYEIIAEKIIVDMRKSHSFETSSTSKMFHVVFKENLILFYKRDHASILLN